MAKWLSIAAFLLTLLFWRFAATYQMEINLAICFAGALVLMQAYPAQQPRRSECAATGSRTRRSANGKQPSSNRRES
jgi:hypothetical protein